MDFPDLCLKDIFAFFFHIEVRVFLNAKSASRGFPRM